MAAKFTKLSQGHCNQNLAEILHQHTICENLVFLGIIELELSCEQG